MTVTIYELMEIADETAHQFVYSRDHLAPYYYDDVIREMYTRYRARGGRGHFSRDGTPVFLGIKGPLITRALKVFNVQHLLYFHAKEAGITLPFPERHHETLPAP